MRRTTNLANIRLLFFALISVCCLGQIPKARTVPDNLPPETHSRFQQRFTSLQIRWEEIRSAVEKHNQECHEVEEGSSADLECQRAQQRLNAEIKDYSSAVETFNRAIEAGIPSNPSASQPSETKETSTGCDKVARQAHIDRDQIERQMRTNQLSQEELAGWSALNDKAQKDAVEAGIKFVLGEYASGAEPLRGSVSKVEQKAVRLAQKAASPATSAAQMKYISRLDSVMHQMASQEIELSERIVVKTGLETDETWKLARNTMQHEFRVAAKQNQELREVLQDPYFKNTFIGDQPDTPGAEVLGTLTDHAVEELSKFSASVEKYDFLVGKAVRAAVFARDASYSALLSYLSTQRVLQQSDLAGSLAISAGVFQKQYKNSVDALRVCREGSFSE